MARTGGVVETGQIFFALLVGVPIMALAMLGSLWLVYVVKRPLLGIVGLAIVGTTYCYGEGRHSCCSLQVSSPVSLLPRGLE